MNRIKIPVELQKMNELFARNGFEAYLVGGAVRDVVLGTQASDWDVATDATPKDVMRIFRRVIPTGLAHGTVTVLFMRRQIEVTTYRTECGYSDGRHPDSVAFASSIGDDLSRRDFTMNAIAASLADGALVDPFDGRGDLRRKCIRAVGIARDRFLEDGLRPVRALRFSAQLGFRIQKNTYEAISEPEVLSRVRAISVERFRDELEKLLRAPEPSGALRAMADTGVLALFMPELAACRGVTQADARGYHEFDVFDHSCYACDGAPCGNAAVRLAALLHDVGKPACRSEERLSQADGSSLTVIHFHGHERVSAELARATLCRLRFPNAVTERVCHLIALHMFHYEPTWSDAAVRRFIVRAGMDSMDDLLLLRYADIYGMHRARVSPTSETARLLGELKERVGRIARAQDALSLKDLAVNGRDLIALGVPAGKQVGRILQELFQCVLDDPAMNTREQLLGVAARLAQ